MRAVEVHHGAATDTGRVREVNEDSYLVAPPVFVVADGMGGHDGGDVASRIVVEEFRRLAEAGYDPEQGPAVVAETLTSCHERIEEYGAEQRRGGNSKFQAGTTAVVALLVEDAGEAKWLLANVGDSRIYRYVDGELEQVSVDHSVVQEMVDAGVLRPDDVAEHPKRHVITRAVGGSEPAEADYFVLPLTRAERLLLCSDGVSGMLDDDDLARILTDATDPRDAAESLVAAAVAAGGEDNATAVVIDVVGWADDVPDDSEHRRESLQQKLGALP